MTGISPFRPAIMVAFCSMSFSVTMPFQAAFSYYDIVLRRECIRDQADPMLMLMCLRRSCTRLQSLQTAQFWRRCRLLSNQNRSRRSSQHGIPYTPGSTMILSPCSICLSFVLAMLIWFGDSEQSTKAQLHANMLQDTKKVNIQDRDGRKTQN